MEQPDLAYQVNQAMGTNKHRTTSSQLCNIKASTTSDLPCIVTLTLWGTPVNNPITLISPVQWGLHFLMLTVYG